LVPSASGSAIAGAFLPTSIILKYPYNKFICANIYKMLIKGEN
jgi:hypothetical protein